ncbi:MAG: PorP/SprF family type IX secretion system membrane protein [Bacteroidales bacterium]|nr:PorP/SprF family type IX secretion system membrane protein [Bacteroidales bacterium]
MKKIIVVLSVILFAVNLFAQNEPVFSNYLTEKTIINPAAAGTNPNTKINLLAKNYFLGFAEKNPGTQVLSLSTKKDYYGIGLILSNDYFGNTRSTVFNLAYAYHLKLNDIGYVSISLAPKFRQFALNQSEYQYFDNDDPAISGTTESKIVFDADFGAAIYSDSYYAAIGVKNLLEPNVSLGGNTSEENKILRVFNLNADYKFMFNDDFHLEPSLYFAYSSADLFYDINARAIIKNLIWAGASYKSTKSISVMFGVMYKNIHFGYAYDHSFAKISSFSNGSHEIVLGYEFVKPESKAKM